MHSVPFVMPSEFPANTLHTMRLLTSIQSSESREIYETAFAALFVNYDIINFLMAACVLGRGKKRQ